MLFRSIDTIIFWCQIFYNYQIFLIKQLEIKFKLEIHLTS